MSSSLSSIKFFSRLLYKNHPKFALSKSSSILCLLNKPQIACQKSPFLFYPLGYTYSTSEGNYPLKETPISVRPDENPDEADYLLKLEPTSADCEPVLPKEKLQAVKIELDEKDLIEKFIKGSGNGGQAINKTNSCVELTHIPTGIVVQCQKTRSQAQNRQIARKLLKTKLDTVLNGKLSKTSKKAAKVLKQKAKQKKRAKAKYLSQSKADENSEVPQSSVETKQ